MPDNDISGDLSFGRPGFNPKIGIQFSVVGKAEHKRCNELLKELVSKAQKAQRNANSSVKLFTRLRCEIEQFDELLDFFDVTPVALAASFLQLTLHSKFVKKLARKAPIITANRGKGKSYELPVPVMVLVLKSKSYKNKHGERLLNDNPRHAGESEMTYSLDKEGEDIICNILEEVPANVIDGAMQELTYGLYSSVAENLIKVMKACGFSNGNQAGIDESSQSEFGKRKLKELLSDVADGEYKRETLETILKDDDMRSVFLDGFESYKEWLSSGHKSYDNVMPMPGEILAEA